MKTLLPSQTDYYFKPHSVSNIASLMANNVHNVDIPRYKTLLQHRYVHKVKYKLHGNNLPIYSVLPFFAFIIFPILIVHAFDNTLI